MVRSILLFVFSMFLICGCKDDLLGSGEMTTLKTNLLQLSSEAQNASVEVEGEKGWYFLGIEPDDSTTIIHDTNIEGDWYKASRGKKGKRLNIEVEENISGEKRSVEIEIYNGFAVPATLRIEQAAGN